MATRPASMSEGRAVERVNWLHGFDTDADTVNLPFVAEKANAIGAMVALAINK